MDDDSIILFVLSITEYRQYTREVGEKYNVRTVYSLKEMEKCINKNNISLIIIDNGLVENQNDETLIKWVSTRKMIPVMVIVKSHDEALRAIEMKATDFIVRPIIPQLLMHRIDRTIRHMEEAKMNTKINVTINDRLREKSKQLSETQASIIEVISEIVEFRDFETKSHNLRTQSYVKLMIRKMVEITNPYQKEISLWDIEDHILSAQLHDIGKIIISNEILMKPGPLTDKEYEIVKGHVVAGVNVIDKIIKKIGNISYLSIAKKYIESHHEYWDGNGYPYKLSRTNIPLEGRILAIVDAYDVITSERSYKKKIAHEEASEIINKQSGKQFDPELVKIFNMASKEFKFLSTMNT